MKYAVLFLALFTTTQSIAQFYQGNIRSSMNYSTRINDRPFGPIDSRLDEYDVHFYFIDLEADNASTDLKGNVTITASIVDPEINEFVVEMADELIVSKVTINDIEMISSHENDLLTIDLSSPVESGDLLSVRISYQGKPTSDAGFFAGISNDVSSSGSRITWTLSEPFNASDWFPVKQVLTDKADSAYIYITVPDNLMAGAPGILTKVQPLDPHKNRYEWQTHYPIAYYLLSMAIGPYTEYNNEAVIDPAEAPVPIQNFIYNDPGVLEKYKDDLDEIPDLLALFSDLYGLYPFRNEKYGHCLAPIGGGMEHQTMSTMQTFDFTLDAHEMAHQWFGDYVTCASFRDIWLNEGMASYAEYLAIENLRSKNEADEWMANAYARVLNKPGGSIYVPENNTDPNRIFDSRLTYNKGGILVHMLRFLMDDDDLFFASLRSFLNEYAGKTATGADFRDYVSAFSGISLDNFFDQWYYGEGYPTYHIYWAQDAGQLTVQLSQQTSSPTVTPLFTIPVPIRIISDDGATDVRITPESSLQEFIIPVSGQVTSVIIDPDNRILKKIDQEITGTLTPDQPVFRLYPNPARAEVRITYSESIPSRIEIVDMQGKMVLTQPVSGQQTILLLNGIPPSVYIVRAVGPYAGFFRKLVIE